LGKISIIKRKNHVKVTNEMNEKLTLTIHGTRHGLKQYELGYEFKKVVYLGLFVLFLLICVGVFSIIYLNESLDISKEGEAYARSEYENMKQTHETLYENMTQVQQDLNEKEEELHETRSRLEQIEARMGLVNMEEMPFDVRIDMAEVTADQLGRLFEYIPNGSPIEYNGITSKFGYRIHPTLGTKEFHRGTDLKAKMDTPVYATANAVVEYSGFHKSSGYGNLVILDHNYGFRTFFGHLNKTVVSSGTYVKKGDLVGYTGNSGLSNGPHLHYEVRFIQHALNPYWFIKWTAKNPRQIFQKEQQVPWQSLIAAMTPADQKIVAIPQLLQQEPTLAAN
jgi:murein DD-endopeptidase MepM/ murein hydrolase activator NlpD